MKRLIAILLLTTTILICSGFAVPENTETEYETANIIWNYLKDLDYNDYVCAGILGNMMVECGGHTLDIDPTAETKSYYGICQWSRKYYPDVIGVSLDAQCNYLRDTIKYEIDTFGFLYSKKFNYEQFLTLEDEKDVALAFAKSYERCGSESYEIRQDCATVAYDFFTKWHKETSAQLQPWTAETKKWVLEIFEVNLGEKL